jgi:hypothetical protein
MTACLAQWKSDPNTYPLSDSSGEPRAIGQILDPSVSKRSHFILLSLLAPSFSISLDLRKAAPLAPMSGR